MRNSILSTNRSYVEQAAVALARRSRTFHAAHVIRRAQSMGARFEDESSLELFAAVNQVVDDMVKDRTLPYAYSSVAIRGTMNQRPATFWLYQPVEEMHPQVDRYRGVDLGDLYREALLEE